MKKLVLSSFLFLSFFIVNGQGVNLGIKAGMNMAKLSGEVPNVSEIKMRNGLHLGIFADLKLSDKFAISPEAIYSKQGAQLDGADVNLAYVNFPVLAKVYFAKFFNLHAGPQFGMLMSAAQEETDIKEHYKDYDLSVAGGLGVDVPFGLTGGVRYNLGLGSISETNVDQKNQFFQIYVGYSFL